MHRTTARTIVPMLVVGALLAAPSPATAVVPARVVVVGDPARDAEGTPPVRRLAEIHRVRYATPAATGGPLQITVRFGELVRGQRPGTVWQHVGILIAARDGCRTWLLTASNKGPASLAATDYCSEGPSDAVLEPRTLRVTNTAGTPGVMRIVMSPELITAARVELRTVAQVGNGRASDFTDFTPFLTLRPR